MNITPTEVKLMIKAVYRKLMQQLNDICYMHWRSMKQQRYPVTSDYARMLAKQASWFTE